MGKVNKLFKKGTMLGFMLAATLAANRPEANMANEDACRFKEVA